MAKLTDKFYERVIEGPLEATEEITSVVNQGIESGDIKVGAKIETLGQATLAYDGVLASLHFNRFDYSKYDLLLLTISGSLFVFLSSPNIVISGNRACCSMVFNQLGETTIARAVMQITDDCSVTFAITNHEFSFNEPPYGILIGVKL